MGRWVNQARTGAENAVISQRMSTMSTATVRAISAMAQPPKSRGPKTPNTVPMALRMARTMPRIRAQFRPFFKPV